MVGFLSVNSERPKESFWEKSGNWDFGPKVGNFDRSGPVEHVGNSVKI